MTVLRADSATLNAHALKKRREAVPVTIICVVIALAILFIDYRAMLFSLMALGVAAVPLAEAVRARRLAKRYATIELDWSGETMTWRLDGYASPLPREDVPSAVVHPDALVLVLKRGKKHERWAIPASQAELDEAERALQLRKVAVHREKFGPAQMVAILGGVVAFFVVSFAAAGMVLYGAMHVLFALTGRAGSLLTGALFLGGALLLFTGVMLAARLAR